MMLIQLLMNFRSQCVKDGDAIENKSWVLACDRNLISDPENFFHFLHLYSYIVFKLSELT